MKDGMMSKTDWRLIREDSETESADVIVLEATADEIRALDTRDDKLNEALDEVQGSVFSGNNERAYLIIKVVK